MREMLNYMKISLLAIFQSLSCITEEMEEHFPHPGSSAMTVQETPEVWFGTNSAHF